MDIDEKIICMVQKYDCLYNIKAKSYSDKNAKSNAWGIISQEINLPVIEVQKKWKLIRDCYRKAIRLRKSKKGAARINNKPIKYESELQFIKPFVHITDIHTSLDSSDTEEIVIDTDHFVSRSRQQSQLSNEERSQKVSQYLTKDYFESKQREEDPTDSFFLTMSRKVKLMPKKMQAELERDIFRLVNEAEIQLASDQDVLGAIPFETEEQNAESSYISNGVKLEY